jgi:DNA primase
MKAEGVSFRHAVELLRADLPTSGVAGQVKRATVKKLPPPVSFDADDQALLRQVVDYYHSTLQQSPEALAYLAKRGLRSPELIERYRLGFANRTLGLRLPDTSREGGSGHPGAAAEARPHPRKRARAPQRLAGDSDHRCAGQRAGDVREEDHTEPPDRDAAAPVPAGAAPRGLQRGGAGRDEDSDSLRGVGRRAELRAAGLQQRDRSYGVEGFTEELLACFQRKGIERVLIAYDRDEAGEKAAQALAPKLMAEGFECYRVQFPPGMDANEVLVKESERSFEQALTRAEWLGKGASAVQREATKRAQAWAAEQRVKQAAVGVEPTVSPLAAAVASAIAPPLAGAPTSSKAAPPLPAMAEAPPIAQEPAPAVVEALAAPPAPSPTKATEPAGLEGREDEVVLHFADRRYRVRGLSKNTSFDALKVNLLVSKGDTFHVDTLDLYSAKARSAFVAQALTELRLDADLLKHDLGQVLLKLEGLHEEGLRKLAEPKVKAVRDPKLLERILGDFDPCGVVGEETNKLVGYLAAVSRKLAAAAGGDHPVELGGGKAR